MTTYLAIFEQANGDKFVIEYRPMYEEIAGGIEILSVDYIPRPRSPFELRQRSRRRGIELTDQEQHAEAMRPTTRLEQMDLFK